MFLFSSKKKQPKKVSSEFTSKVQQIIKERLCPLCEKYTCTKLAFGDQLKPLFTCKNCELKAVDNNIQNLSEKNLITNQKFSNVLTMELTNYQNSQNEPSVQFKKNIETGQTLEKNVKEISVQIKEEVKKLRQTTKDKLGELTKQAQKQNQVIIFQQTMKNMNEKKPITIESALNMAKKSIINIKGIHFVDEQRIEGQNNEINNRFAQLKKQTKIKIKSIYSLAEQINNIKL